MALVRQAVAKLLHATPFGRAVRQGKWVATAAPGSWNCFITLATPSG